jgi:hypothetical protein
MATRRNEKAATHRAQTGARRKARAAAPDRAARQTTGKLIDLLNIAARQAAKGNPRLLGIIADFVRPRVVTVVLKFSEADEAKLRSGIPTAARLDIN